MPPIETERLILRNLRPDDIEGMYLLDSDPLVHRCLLNLTEKHSGDFVEWSGVALGKKRNP